MDNALGDSPVDLRDCHSQRLLGRACFAAIDECAYTFDMGPHRRAEVTVAYRAFDRLTISLFCLKMICHFFPPFVTDAKPYRSALTMSSISYRYIYILNPMKPLITGGGSLWNISSVSE